MKRKIDSKKMTLILSGVVFIFFTTPPWVRGICAATAAAMIWVAAAWKLPTRDVRSKGVYSAALVVAVLFGFNFYHSWKRFGLITGLAGVLGIPGDGLALIITGLGALASVPAIGYGLSYLCCAGMEEFRRTRQISTGNEKRISSGKAFLILFAVYAIGISGIIRANFYYADDNFRLFSGGKGWSFFGRYLSDALSTFVHMGDFLPDVAPLSQLLAMLVLAGSAVLLLNILFERTEFSVWELAAAVMLGLNPYFLECISYRFDSPYMAFSVFVSVFPLLYRRRNSIAYIFAAFLGSLGVCTSYQSAAGIFPMIVVLLALRMWKDGETMGKTVSFCLKSVAGYGAGLLYFVLILMKPAAAGYVSNEMSEIGHLFPNFLGNLKQYYAVVLSDFKPIWLILSILVVTGFAVSIVSTSKRKVLPTVAMSMVAFVLMAFLSFGIYPALEQPLFRPRAMYGIGVLLTLLGIITAEGKGGIPLKTATFVLSWAFFVFSFTYGSALSAQKEYTQFRTYMVIQDINEMEVFQSGDEVRVQITGDIGIAPMIRNLPQNYDMLNRLIPTTFGVGNDEGDLPLLSFYQNYDLRNVTEEQNADFSKLDLPVVKDNMYHTICAEGNQVLIKLK